MGLSPETRKFLPIIVFGSFLLIFGALAGIFFYRAPVLIVTDSSFNTLYGPKRVEEKQLQTAISLFRRVFPVVVSENAGPNLVAIAVGEAYRQPRAVLFPFRYHEGAKIYKDNNPEVAVVVVGGSSRALAETEKESIAYVRTDVITDLHRAGMCAASLAGGKNILIFDEEMFQEESRESLRDLLMSRGFQEEPLFMRPNEYVASFADIGCVILASPAFRFLEQSPDVPVILFSWHEPALTPWMVKLVFDDSPWALSAKALKTMSPGKVLIPSVWRVLTDRFGERKDSRKLKSLLKQNFQENEKKQALKADPGR